MVSILTKVEEDEFGLDGRTQFDDQRDGDVDDQQPQHDPPQLPQQTQPEEGLQIRAGPPVTINVPSCLCSGDQGGGVLGSGSHPHTQQATAVNHGVHAPLSLINNGLRPK